MTNLIESLAVGSIDRSGNSSQEQQLESLDLYELFALSKVILLRRESE